MAMACRGEETDASKSRGDPNSHSDMAPRQPLKPVPSERGSSHSVNVASKAWSPACWGLPAWVARDKELLLQSCYRATAA